MAKEESYLLFSLEKEKSKKLAQAISNETARKILNYLSRNDASESYIAKALNLPLSTVHYNLQNLKESNLIKSKDFYWSEKGKKIEMYTVSKKFIVISPAGQALGSSLKNILPVGLGGIIVSGLLYLFSEKPIIYEEALFQSAQKSLALASPAEKGFTLMPEHALWFLLGVFFIVILLLIIDFIRRKRKLNQII